MWETAKTAMFWTTWSCFWVTTGCAQGQTIFRISRNIGKDSWGRQILSQNLEWRNTWWLMWRAKMVPWEKWKQLDPYTTREVKEKQKLWARWGCQNFEKAKMRRWWLRPTMSSWMAPEHSPPVCSWRTSSSPSHYSNSCSSNHKGIWLFLGSHQQQQKHCSQNTYVEVTWVRLCH